MNPQSQFASDHDAQQHAAATADAIRTAPDAGNEPVERPHFFAALDRQHPDKDHCGADWRQDIPARSAAQLGRTHRQAEAVNAIAALLMADFETSQTGSGEERLNAFLREGLFLALTELAGQVHNSLAEVGADLQARELRGVR